MKENGLPLAPQLYIIVSDL